MLSAPFRASLRRLVVALGLGAALAGPASSAYVVGTWDPPFGPPFPNLGWAGEIKVLIPDDCLTLGAGAYANPPAGPLACSGPLTVDYATVTFYDIRQPAQLPTEDLDFSGLVRVTGFSLAGPKQLLGFSAEATGFLEVTSSLLGAGGQSTNTAAFALSFMFNGSGSQAVLNWSQAKNPSCDKPGNNGCQPGGGQGGTGSMPPLTFALFNDDGTPITAVGNTVPEPLSLALVGGGLLGLAAMRRRRAGR